MVFIGTVGELLVGAVLLLMTVELVWTLVELVWTLVEFGLMCVVEFGLSE